MAAHAHDSKVAGAANFATDDAAPTMADETRPALILSPQQAAVCRWVEFGHGNAFVEATAGSGKTSTLVEACKRMGGSVAFMAYNKKAADDIKYKLAHSGYDMSHVRAGTFHSFGFSAWRRAHPKVEVDDYGKRKRMVDECEVSERLESVVCKLVSLAKQGAIDARWNGDDLERIIDHHDLMFDLDTVDEVADRFAIIDKAFLCIDWARKVGGELIDFDDMIWLTVTSKVRVWTNDFVCVDESQDSNPARRALAAKMVSSSFKTGRAIFVGDRFQSILGFTGADNDAVDIIIRDFKCVSLPLTVSYRCPKAVVALARRFVPHIEAHEDAPDGIVRACSRDAFLKSVETPNTRIPAEADQLQPTDAILCRKTRPLVALAFALIRRKVGCHVEGRDIGSGLVKLATRWKVTSCAALAKNLEAFRVRETAKLTARLGKEGGVEYALDALNDRIDTLLIVMEGCATISEVVALIERMFKDTDGGKASTVTLSTIHKAKGREWSGKVYILGWDVYMPSPFARKKWMRDQESHLAYVAVTRAMNELVLLPALED